MSKTPRASVPDHDPFVRVRGARVHNLRDVDVDIPRDALVAFTGISGSGKSSLAFATIYAEAQRRYFESIAPYARRLLNQVPAPQIKEITGLPPAVALQQRRGSGGARSTVGTLTTLSNLLRLLMSRAGTYPPGTTRRLDSDAFSPNTPVGACPTCHGLGRTHVVSERLMVPDPELSIRQGAVAAWPGAWQGVNLRDILVALGHDVDRPWRKLPKSVRDWILYTDEQPVVEVHPQRERGEGIYNGRFWSARSYIMHTLTNSRSAKNRERALRFVEIGPCPTCGGTGLRPEALKVTFAGRTIADLVALPLSELAEVLRPAAEQVDPEPAWEPVAVTLATDLCERIGVLVDLGLGYLNLSRPAPTLSPGEAQRLRIATQLRSGLFGVVYVLDEPSAGLHPADAEPLMRVLDGLRAAHNSIFVVEHDMDVVRRADWVVDVGPGAGSGGGQILYSGPVAGLRDVAESATRPYLFGRRRPPRREPRPPTDWLRLRGINRHNLRDLDVDVPLGVLTAVTGVSGSGKSTLVTQVLAEVVGDHLGVATADEDEGPFDASAGSDPDVLAADVRGLELFDRLVRVDQKPIGRTPRSNLATYTGLFDAVRKVFAGTEQARTRGYDPGRFSFNVASGRCPTCQGEGFVTVELIFLPSTYAPCPTCHGARYNEETLQITYRGATIADVLDMTVDEAGSFLADLPAAARSLRTLIDVGLGYLRLGQPATELSGGEAQRIKLATELQRAHRGHTLYLLDEPTTGLHPADVKRLLLQLQELVDARNTVILVEHDMSVVAAADWVIDLGPDGGDAGGQIVAQGPPQLVAASDGHTARYLAERLGHRSRGRAATRL